MLAAGTFFIVEFFEVFVDTGVNTLYIIIDIENHFQLKKSGDEHV